MANQNRASRLLIAALVAVVHISSASAFHRWRSGGLLSMPWAGLHGRKLLFPSTCTGNGHIDYAPAGMDPPDCPYLPPATMKFDSGNSKIRDVHSDYAPSEIHPLDYPGCPPAATMKFDSWNWETGNAHSDDIPTETQTQTQTHHPDPFPETHHAEPFPGRL